MAATTGDSVRSSSFFLRRLHSLLGIVPVGVFLVVHLTINTMVLFVGDGEDPYQDSVHLIHSLGPLLVPVEIVGIFLPLAFHACLGVKIWREGRTNVRAYRTWGNVRYTLQRVTGVIAILFLLVHLWHLHWLGEPLKGGLFDPEDASASAAFHLKNSGGWMWLLYYVGIPAACFHFANGIWTSLITWGIAIGPNVQRRTGYACAVLGVVLTTMGLAAMRGFLTFEAAAAAP